jgi:hypothetical protein
MEVSDQLHASAALPPQLEPRYTLERRLHRPHSRSGRGGAEKQSAAPPGNRSPVVQPVA